MGGWNCVQIAIGPDGVSQVDLENLLVLRNRCERAETLFARQAESVYDRLESGGQAETGVHEVKIEQVSIGLEEYRALVVDGRALYVWSCRGRRAAGRAWLGDGL